MAAITLGGLVRCGNDERVVEHLLAEFKNAATTPTTSAEQLIIRHSGVLGMSALALAHPYEIPRWLPDTLVLIGRHASDPAPINATVKHTFAEFRRTHQDSWYEDVLRAGGGPAHTEYSDLYDYTPTEKSSTSRGARKTEAARGKKGVFTAAHLEALEGLLTSSGVNYYV